MERVNIVCSLVWILLGLGVCYAQIKEESPIKEDVKEAAVGSREGKVMKFSDVENHIVAEGKSDLSGTGAEDSTMMLAFFDEEGHPLNQDEVERLTSQQDTDNAVMVNPENVVLNQDGADVVYNDTDARFYVINPSYKSMYFQKPGRDSQPQIGYPQSQGNQIQQEEIPQLSANVQQLVDSLQQQIQSQLNEQTAQIAQQLPQIVPAQQLTQILPTQQLPQIVPAQQLPQIVPAQQLPQIVPAQQLPHIVPAQQLPHIVPAQQLPHIVPVQQLPQIMPTQQLPQILSAVPVSSETNPVYGRPYIQVKPSVVYTTSYAIETLTAVYSVPVIVTSTSTVFQTKVVTHTLTKEVSSFITLTLQPEVVPTPVPTLTVTSTFYQTSLPYGTYPSRSIPGAGTVQHMKAQYLRNYMNMLKKRNLSKREASPIQSLIVSVTGDNSLRNIPLSQLYD